MSIAFFYQDVSDSESGLKKFALFQVDSNLIIAIMHMTFAASRLFVVRGRVPHSIFTLVSTPGRVRRCYSSEMDIGWKFGKFDGMLCKVSNGYGFYTFRFCGFC